MNLSIGKISKSQDTSSRETPKDMLHHKKQNNKWTRKNVRLTR